MGHRREQLASILRRTVQNVLTRGLGDPRIRGLITVTEVEVTGDLREAVVHVSILPPECQAATMQGLTAATLHLQKLVNDELDLRRPPHLRFRLDERLKKEAQLLSAIRHAVAELPPTAGTDDPRGEFEARARADEAGSRSEDAPD